MLPPVLRPRRLRPGFTLIELLTVVAMGGILMAIAARGFTGARDRSANSQVESNLRQVQIAIETYQADYDKFPAALVVDPVADTAGGRTPDFLLNPRFDKRYLPANRLPLTPWHQRAWQGNTRAAPASVQDAGMFTLTAARASLDRPIAPPRNPARAAAGGLLPAASAGPVNFDVTTSRLIYGTLLYETNADRTVYLLHGIGKRGGDAMVVGIGTNLR